MGLKTIDYSSIKAGPTSTEVGRGESYASDFSKTDLILAVAGTVALGAGLFACVEKVNYSPQHSGDYEKVTPTTHNVPEPTNTPKAELAKDSDGGINPYVKGTVVADGKTPFSIAFDTGRREATDYCALGTNDLKEYYPHVNGGIDVATISKPGYKCVDGALVKE